MRERISVIVTVYNIEELLSQAINSIVDQLYSNLEILIIDDGSSDMSSVLCDSYLLMDPRIVVIHKKNEGLSAARKTGVEGSSGEYIGFVDGDDTIDPEMYQKLHKNLIDNDADISHCGFKMITPYGEIKNFYGTNKTVIQDHKKGIIDLLLGEYIEPSTCTKLYKKSLFKHVSYETSISINEDLMLNSMLFAKSQKSVFYDFCPYNYFQHSCSMSSSVTEKHFIDPITVREHIVKNYQNEDSNIQNIAKTMLAEQYISNCFQIREKYWTHYKRIYYSQIKKLKMLVKQVSLRHNAWIRAMIVLYFPFMCRPIHMVYRYIHGAGKYSFKSRS